mgnify:CR=1 FL=1
MLSVPPPRAEKRHRTGDVVENSGVGSSSHKEPFGFGFRDVRQHSGSHAGCKEVDKTAPFRQISVASPSSEINRIYLSGAIRERSREENDILWYKFNQMLLYWTKVC